METFTPARWFWTDEDWEKLPFGDTFIHGIGFTGTSLLLDIDFLVHGEPPAAGEVYGRSWLAPSTLRFEDADDVVMKLIPFGGLILLDMDREPRPRRQDGRKDWFWRLNECCSEGITLRATGFSLFVRAVGQMPRVHAACLSAGERGGISFDCAAPGG